MGGTTQLNRDIHLITDDDALYVMILDMFDALPQQAAFKGNRVIRLSSVQSARAMLTSGRRLPILIVLDGAVRHTGVEPVQTDGSPAAALLADLRTDHNVVPVVVVSQGSLEKLEYEVLQRWDIALWKPPPPSSLQQLVACQEQFARILEGLSSESAHHKREITISVGMVSATYSIMDSYYTFELSRALDRDQLFRLIRRLKQFSPFLDGVLQSNWQDILADAGQDLYKLMVESVFGWKLLEKVQAYGYGVDFRFHVELSTDSTNDGLDDLFLLPFEAANADLKPENFLCARVPMGRRIARASVRPSRVITASPLKCLLIVGAEGGVSRIRDDRTGVPEQVNLSFLRLAGEVRSKLATYSSESGSSARRTLTLDVLDVAVARGRGFRDELMKRLTGTEYDVVHYYGHSVATPGGTFLVVPGEDDYTGYPVSIRAVAGWIKQVTHTSTKHQLPSLVLLSSCQSGSVLTALEMVRAGVENVIGFRWEVDEESVADYVAAFYAAYAGRGEPVTEAYRYACDEVRRLSQGTPGWASAIAIIND